MHCRPVSRSLRGFPSIRPSTTAFRSPSAARFNWRVGAGAFGEDRVDVLGFLADAEFIQHVVDELEQFQGQEPERHLFALAEVDQLAVDGP